MATIISGYPVGRSRPEILGDPRERKRMTGGAPHSRTGTTGESPPSLFLDYYYVPTLGTMVMGWEVDWRCFLTCSSRSQRRF